ncbi:MAG: hypothetical protein DMF85_07590 [Acidobacteria bacterium]|nr:MAG: hypothetical protein DMF85_07590 [Acidobacteriota bacterium]
MKRCSDSATGRSVPGRGARCRSAFFASDVVLGSMTTSFAPACCASLRNGTRWMPEADGFTPQSTISFAWT